MTLIRSVPQGPAKNGLKQIARSYYGLLTRVRKPYEYAFLLSHMRSGSSLFAHLLASHPDICGYGEAHVTYRSMDDLDVLRYRVLFTQRRFFAPGSERYLLDKVLHDRLLRPQVSVLLNSDRIKVIFLLREPLASIASIVNALHYSEADAVTYYVDRLSTLCAYARSLDPEKQCVFVTYEQILEETRAVFDLLQRYLELTEPLSEEYAILSTTGRGGIGDMSPKIRSGTIIRDRPQETSGLSPSNHQLVLDSYQTCRDLLSQISLLPSL